MRCEPHREALVTAHRSAVSRFMKIARHSPDFVFCHNHLKNMACVGTGLESTAVSGDAVWDCSIG
jgi:hypothetical protein